MIKSENVNRREFIALAAALGLGSVSRTKAATLPVAVTKVIPSNGERIPVIGIGTSRTFNARGNTDLLVRLLQVIQTFFDMGGGMIDSSPMYGSAQSVLGQLLPKVKGRKNLFAATKVWTDGRQQGIEQMEESRQLWSVDKFDLMQIHNLVDWQTHLETLQQMKADGKIRYVGITTSHGRYHGQLEKILQQYDFDFVQLSYNIANRTVELPLLSIAQEKGVAVIVNRPFARGDLFRKVKGKPLPAWAKDFDCNTWGQYFLKYVVSHPAVTCAIPATSKVKHLIDNMQAGRGRLPAARERSNMLSYLESI